MIEIYGTLGPACSDADTLEGMFRAGMTGVRLNLSHGTLKGSAGMLLSLREAAERCGVKPRLIMDLQGPELRIGAAGSEYKLTEGETVTLGGDGIPVPNFLPPYLEPGRQIVCDDGKILLEITRRTENGAEALVLRGETLRGRKSAAIDGAQIYPPPMTESDKENIAAAVSYGVTDIMQSFVRSRSDLEEVRAELDRNGGESLRLLAKIEDLDGVARLGEMLPVSDEIVIARGDLGNAVPLWELPILQKRIAAVCRERNEPFMVVTQLLASMEDSPVPTRAEVTDIFNAVLDGATSVMVTGETAVGKYPVETISYLARTAAAAVRFMEEKQK